MVVVWIKRDLRLSDNEPLCLAIATQKPILLLYAFEPLWTENEHYGQKHIDFIKQSLVELQRRLNPFNTKILVVERAVIDVLKELQFEFGISTLYSYQESGMLMTYQRDIAIKNWCDKNGVVWKECVQNGVIRGIKHRKNWKDQWVNFVNAPVQEPDLSNASFFSTKVIDEISSKLGSNVDLSTPKNKGLQHGGPWHAKRYLTSFFEYRIRGYNRHYSNPMRSRLHSSRLSPYIAWGNLSVREVVHYALKQKKTANKKTLNAFLSRLRWQAHFIQKFESEGQMEFKSINSGYHSMEKVIRPSLQSAWKKGGTGVPMVDAAMRCLVATGFVNFRLRALLASFFTHLLWQPWQDCSAHLARHFLDFDPGIHFSQLNMQSGETGINTIRIYNPIKNGKEHDPKGIFIKKWVPELRKVPLAYIHEPWKMPLMEAQFINFTIGIDYPKPIVDLEAARKHASDTLYQMKKNEKVQQEGQRIILRHTIPNRPVWDNQI